MFVVQLQKSRAYREGGGGFWGFRKPLLTAEQFLSITSLNKYTIIDTISSHRIQIQYSSYLPESFIHADLSL